MLFHWTKIHTDSLQIAFIVILFRKQISFLEGFLHDSVLLNSQCCDLVSDHHLESLSEYYSNPGESSVFNNGEESF